MCHWSWYRINGTHKYLTRETLRQKYLLQGRRELPSFAFLCTVLTYKYDALTDCAIGGGIKLTEHTNI